MVREDLELINKMIRTGNVDTNKVSDGYHTFGELYSHRIALFIALSNLLGHGSWKSKLHSDGTSFDGWFIAGINFIEGEQISYHLPMDQWDLLTSYELDKAPPFDGHTPDDVIQRLNNMSKYWGKR